MPVPQTARDAAHVHGRVCGRASHAQTKSARSDGAQTAGRARVSLATGGAGRPTAASVARAGAVSRALAAAETDLYGAMVVGATIAFAQPDALKGGLIGVRGVGRGARRVGK